jgi:hypothetical protein
MLPWEKQMYSLQLELYIAMGKSNVFIYLSSFMLLWEREMYSSMWELYDAMGKRNVFISVGALCCHGKETCIAFI